MGLLFDIAKCCLISDVEQMNDIEIFKTSSFLPLCTIQFIPSDCIVKVFFLASFVQKDSFQINIFCLIPNPCKKFQAGGIQNQMQELCHKSETKLIQYFSSKRALLPFHKIHLRYRNAIDQLKTKFLKSMKNSSWHQQRKMQILMQKVSLMRLKYL